MRKDQYRLTLVKVIHTVVWAAMVGVIAFVLWSGLTKNVTEYSWLAVGIVVLEGVVLLVFKGHCPLTDIARRHSASTKDNFDIYLPEWLARYNKVIFTTLFIIGLLFMIANC